MTRRKVVIYVGCTDMDNLGDDAVYESIRQAFYPEFFFFPVSYKKKVESLTVFKALKRKPDIIMLGGGTLISRGPNEGYLKLLKQVMGVFKDTKLVVFGPGVSEIRLANLAGIPTDVEAWSEVLNEAQSISVRGKMSKSFLEEWGIVNPVRICGDPAVYLTLESFEYKKKEKKIAVNFCDIIGRIHGLSSNSVEQFGKAIVKKLIEEGWNIYVFPTASSDTEYMNQFYLEGYEDRVNYFPYTRDIHKAQAFLKEMDIFVGMRLHAIAFSINVCTPFFAIEYHSKTYDFLESMGLQEYSMRTDQLDPVRALNHINDIYSKSSSVQDCIFERAITSKNNFISEVKYLKNQLI